MLMKRKLVAACLSVAMIFSIFVPNVALALDSAETEETTETSENTDETYEPEVVSESSELAPETSVTETSTAETSATETEVNETDETMAETEETNETDETSETSETEETEETEPELVAFDQTVVVDGTRIQVIADEGVFPEGAYLEATRIESIDIDRGSNINLVDTMSFDICIYNEDGVEIEPDTEAGSVSVLFFDERISDTNLDTTIYHIEDNTPTSLDYNYIDGNGDVTGSEDIAVAVEAATDGFSVYTVEFTYNDIFYVLDGDTSVSLSTILEAVGLTGDVENVSISNTSLIGYDGTNVTALQPFNSTESMIITINGVDYEIIITDANDIATCGDDAYAIIYDNGTMVIQKGNTADSTIGTAAHILALGVDNTPWLDLNNNIDYTAEITNVIFNNELVGRTSLSGFFATCSNITSIAGLNLIDTSEVTNIGAMFYGCASLATIDVSDFDTSTVTDMTAMFSGCSSLSSLNVSNFNTSNVTNMSSMFYGCSSLTTLDLSTFNMSKVTMTGSMFTGCTSLDTLILDNWDLGNTYTISSMLGGLNVTNLSAKNWKNFPTSFTHVFGRSVGGAATNIDVTGWDLTGVTSISGLFCSSAIENIVGINTWTNTDDLTDISQMFYGANITSVNLSGLDTSNVTNFSSMFSGCTKLESIDLSTFVFNCDMNGTGGMFSGTTSALQTIILPESFSNATNGSANSLSLIGYWTKEGETEEILGSNIISGGTYNAVEITDRAIAGYNAEAILYSDGTLVFCIKPEDPSAASATHGSVVAYWDVGTSNNPWVANATQITKVDFQDRLTERTSANQMFNGCTYLTTVLHPENFDTSKVMTMYEMFYNCKALSSINVSTWDTSNCSVFEFMFNSCTSLATVTGATNFITSEATNLWRMFQNCSSLRTIDVSGWNVSNVIYMTGLFRGCSSLTTLDVSNWNTVKLQRADQLFYGCSSLTTIDIADWDMTKVIDAGWMFWGCSSVTELDVSDWSLPNLKTTSSNGSVINSMFCGCSKITELDLSNWGLSGVTIADHMFNGCTSLERLDLSGFDMSSVTSTASMFYNTSALEWLKINNTCKLTDSYGRLNAGPWTDISNDTAYELSAIFTSTGSRAGTYTSTSNTATAGVDLYAVLYKNSSSQYVMVFQKGNTAYSEYGTFQEAVQVNPTAVATVSNHKWFTVCRNLDIEQIIFRNKVVGITDFSYFFYDFHGWRNGNRGWSISNLRYLDTSAATSMKYMFGSSYNLTSSLADLDTSTITDMSYMFYYSYGGESFNFDGLSAWNTSNVTNMSYMFASSVLSKRGNVDMLATWDVSNVTNMNGMFYALSGSSSSSTSGTTTYGLTDISGLANWNVSNVENMNSMFSGCYYLSDFSALANWHPNNVTGLSGTFDNTGISDLTIFTNWDVSHVVGTTTTYGSSTIYFGGGFSSTFESCRNITTLAGLENWDVSNCIDFERMFNGCTSLEDISALQGWNINSARTLREMFRDCSKIESIESLQYWVPSHVEDMIMMFNNCSTIDSMEYIRSWNTSSLQNINSIFNGCSKIDTVYFDEWDLSHITISTNALANMANLSTFIIGDNYAGGSSFGLSGSWYHVDTDTEIEDISSHFNTFTADKAGTYTSYANAGLNANAILYSDGTLVFQRGTEPDSEYGTVVRTWTVPQNMTAANYWNNTTYGPMVRTVIVKDAIHNMTGMQYFFANFTNCSSYIDLDKLDTSKVTNMSYMFYNNATAIVPEDLASWNTDKVTSMRYMFSNSSAIDYSAISAWNIAALTDMSHMFDGNTAIRNIADLANWNVSTITNGDSMFKNCTNLNDLTSLTSWHFDNLTNANEMFRGCTSLADTTGISNWGMSKCTNLTNMFTGCTALVNLAGLNGWTFETANTTLNSIFNGCTNLADLTPIANWNIVNVNNLRYIFFNCTSLTDLTPLANWNTSNVTTLEYAFYGCKNLVSTQGLNNWNTGNVTTLYRTFENCYALSDLSGLASWDVSKVTTTNAMFNVDANSNGTTVGSLTNLNDLANWQLDVCTNLSYMFSHQERLTDVSGACAWTIPAATSISYIFQYTKSLQVIEDIHWSNPNMSWTYAFANCTGLLTLDLSGCTIHNWTNGYLNYMFNYCPNLVEITFPETMEAITNSTNQGLSGNWIRESDNTLYSITTVLSGFTADKADTYYKRYNLRFYAMGGVVNPNYITLNLKDGYQDELPTPVRNGYTFLGWYDTEGNRYETIPADTYITRLYAHWSNNTYTLILNPNRPDLEPVEVELAFGEVYRLDSEITWDPDGYYLYNWTTRASGQGTSYAANQSVVDLATEADQVVNLYAQWMDDAEITVHFHYIDIATGNEIYSVDSEILCGNYFADFNPIPELPSSMSGWRKAYMSFASDLDVVHYDGTGTSWESDSTYSYWDQPEYNFDYNQLTDARARGINESTYLWTIDDDNTDVYVYCIEPYYVHIYFAPQNIENLPTPLTMTIDGVTYSDGEYVVQMPNSDVSYNSRNNYIYTPNYYARRSTSSSGIYAGNISMPNNIQFNYDMFAANYSLYGMPEIFVQSGNNWNWTSDYNARYMVGSAHALPGSVFNAYMPLNAIMTIDGNGGTRYNGDTQYIQTIYLGSGYNPDPTNQDYNIYNSGGFTNGDEAYAGLFTEPTGGYRVNTDTTGVPQDQPLNLIENPTVYIHWGESTPVVTTRHLVTIHNSRATITESSRSFVEGSSFYDDSFFNVLPVSGYYFDGWYTEPNGQGTKLDENFILTEDTEFYANWVTEASGHITFTTWGGEVQPSTVYYNWSKLPDNISGARENGTLIYTYGGATTTLDFDRYAPTVNDANQTYNFIGWYDAPVGGNRVSGTIDLVNDTIYYAHWEVANDPVDFDYNWSISFSSTGTSYYGTYSYDPRDTSVSRTYWVPLHISLGISNIPAGESIAPDNVRILIPAGKPGDEFLPYPQLAPGQEYAYKYETINGTSYLVITNPTSIDGRADLTCTITVNGQSHDPRYSEYSRYDHTAIIQIDSDGDGDYEVNIERELITHNNAGVSYQYYGSLQLQGTLLAGWNTKWGPEPEDVDDYFYVAWKLTGLNGYNVNVANDFNSPSGEIVYIYGRPVTINDRVYDALGIGSDIVVMRYPMTMWPDEEVGRFRITETDYVTQVPTVSTNIRSQSVTGYCDITWDHSHPLEEQGDAWSNMGRHIDNGWNYDTYTGRTRQINTLESMANNSTTNTGDLGWWAVYATPTNSSSDSIDMRVMSFGEGDFVYRSGALDDYYMWNEDNQEVLDESEYYIRGVDMRWEFANSTYSDEDDTYYVERFQHELPVELWVRHRGSNEFVQYLTTFGETQNTNMSAICLNQGNQRNWWQYRTSVAFTDTDIVDVEMRTPLPDGHGYLATELGVRVRLLNDLRVHQWSVSDNNQFTSSVYDVDPKLSYIHREGATETVSPEESYHVAGWLPFHVFDNYDMITIWEITRTSIGSSSIINSTVPQTAVRDNNAKIQTVPVQVNMFNTAQVYLPINAGTMYILGPNDPDVRATVSGLYRLQTRYSYDINSVNGQTTVDQQYYSVETIPNWNGTNRTMVVINFDVSSLGNTNYNGIRAIVNFSKSEVDIYEAGAINNCDIATMLINKTVGIPVYDIINSEYEAALNDNFEALLSGLYQANNSYIDSTVFAQKTFSYQTTTSQQGSAGLYVANSDNIYASADTTSARVYPTEEFSYLVADYYDESSVSNGQYYEITLDGRSVWVGADISTLTRTAQDRDVTLTPIVWYCMSETVDFEHIDAEHGWTQDDPTGQIVYGLVVDYSHADDGNEYWLSGSVQAFEMTIRQKTLPTVAIGEVLQASCNVHYNFLVSGSADPRSQVYNGNVTVVEPIINLQLTSTPESGTAINPTEVVFDQDLDYVLKVTNNGDHAIQNVIVTENIPVGLAVSLDDITVNNVKISESNLVSNVSLENNVLVFTITSLKAGNYLTIKIPTLVNTHGTSSPSGSYALFDNYAYADHCFDISYDESNRFTSNHTYHDLSEPIVVPDPTGLALDCMPFVIALSTIIGALIFIETKKKKSY